MKINIPFSILSLEEGSSIGSSLVSLLKSNHPENENLKLIVDETSGVLGEASKAIASSSKTGLTQKILSEDSEFNSLFIGFKSIVSGYLRSDIVAEREAAEAIDAQLEKNGKDLHERGYDEQKSLFTSLQDDMAGLSEALATLHLDGWYQRMSDKLAGISELVEQRGKITSEDDTLTDKEAKRLLQEQIGFAIDEMNVLVRRGRVEGLDATLAQWEALVSQTITTARARITRSKKDTE